MISAPISFHLHTQPASLLRLGILTKEGIQLTQKSAIGNLSNSTHTSHISLFYSQVFVSSYYKGPFFPVLGRLLCVSDIGEVLSYI